MAKRKAARKKKAAEPVPEEKEECTAENVAAAASKTAGTFFQSLGQGLKAAGSTAERYARLGVCMADLERLRMKLGGAYGKLGENVVKCWDAAPDIGVSATESSIREHLLSVHDLRRRVREIEKKIKALQED